MYGTPCTRPVYISHVQFTLYETRVLHTHIPACFACTTCTRPLYASPVRYTVYETTVHVACTLHRVRDDCTRRNRASPRRAAAVCRRVYRRALSTQHSAPSTPLAALGSRLSAVGRRVIHQGRETVTSRRPRHRPASYTRRSLPTSAAQNTSNAISSRTATQMNDMCEIVRS